MSRRVTISTNPTREARVTPIMAPLFSPEPSGDRMRPLSGAKVDIEAAAIVEVGTAGRSNSVEVPAEVVVKAGVVEDATARVSLADEVVFERVGDVEEGRAPPVAVGLKD
jgi:hypothetical protein